MKKESYISSFKNFNPLKSKFDQFLFKKGQTLLIIQVCINLLVFLLEDNNPFSHRNTFSWYELTFYLFAMFVLAVEMIVAKDFFENIPRTFDELIRRKVVKNLDSEAIAKRFEVFKSEFEEKINYKVPLILAGVTTFIFLFVLQVSMIFPIVYMPENFPFSVLLLNFFTIVIPLSIAGYIMSVAAWKCLVTGYFVHQFSNEFEISIQPSHPDKAVGLKPLGDLIFSMTLILIVASLALSVLTIASQINNAIYNFLVETFSFRFEVVAPFYLTSTEFLARFSLGVVIIFSLVVFFIPIISTHRRMRDEKLKLIDSLSGIGNKIAQLENQAKKLNINYSKRSDIFAEINSLSKIYEISYKTPVWPFDREILIKFFTPQFISLLSLLGIIQPIIDTVSSWVR